MKKNIGYHIAFIIFIILGIFLYSSLIFNNNVWYDEAYSLAMIGHSFSDICKITAADVHPPLYYFGLKIFCMIFGTELIFTKIFSIIPLILTMIMGYRNISKVFTHKEGLIFAAALLLLPLYQIYSVEIRMYTWASFAVFGSGIYAYRAVTEDKRCLWIIYTIFTILSAYLHYFAFVSVLVISFMLLLASVYRYKVSKWFLSAAALVVAYVPWMSSFLGQLSEKVTNEYWIAPITLKTVKEFFNVWLGCGDYTRFFIPFFAIVFVLSLIVMFKKTDFKRLSLSLTVLFVFVGTCLIGIIASLAVRPVFIERYAIPAIPFVLTVIALGLGRIKSKTVITLITIVAILFCGSAYIYTYDIEYNSSESFIEETLAKSQYDSIVCYQDSHLYGVLSYYEPQKPIYRPKISQGSPFKNVLPLDKRNADNEKNILVFMPKGVAVPKWVSDSYNVSFTCEIATYGSFSDMYTCTPF